MDEGKYNRLESEIRDIIDVAKVKTLGLNTKKVVFGNSTSIGMMEKNIRLFFKPEIDEEILLSFNAGSEKIDYAYSSIIITTKKVWFRLMHLNNVNMVNGYIQGSVPLSEISSIKLGSQYQTYFEILINGDNIGYINTMISPTNDFEEFLDFICGEMSKNTTDVISKSILKYCTIVEASSGVKNLNMIMKVVLFISLVIFVATIANRCS